MNIDLSLRPAVVLFVVLTLVTGVAYPVVVTGLGEVGLRHQADGSLLRQGGRTIGSTLIGQSFTDPAHFWGRPSATSPQPNNATASSGSNLGPTNPALVEAVRSRVEALKAANREAGVADDTPVPVDLATASASGLDPEISPEAAAWQAARVAKASGLPLARVESLIADHTAAPQFGFLGMPRVNVLELNVAIDAAATKKAARPA